MGEGVAIGAPSSDHQRRFDALAPSA